MKSHQRMTKVFPGHKISTLEELKQGGAKDIPVKDNPPPLCKVHEEPKKLYCFDCSCLICRDCTLFDHASHKAEFVKKAAPGTRQSLADRLLPLKEVQGKLFDAVEGVKERKKEVDDQCRLNADQLEVLFQELYNILERRKRELLEEASKTAQEKSDRLSLQEKGFNMSLGTVQSLVDFVERTLENASDEEVVTIHGQVLSRIDGEVEKQERGADNLEPIELADIGVDVSIAESLQQICQTKARVFQMEADPSKCIAEGDGVKVAEVDETSRVAVHIAMQNGKPTRRVKNIQAELKSLVSGSVVRVQGVHNRANTYTIEYIPKTRGRHELTINVNSQPIAGSPSPVFVRIPPTKLGEPVREIEGVRKPRYLAFNSTGQMIVTEFDGDVIVFDNGGKMLRSIRRSEFGFGDLAGVAVDKDHNIYVIDWSKDCLYKFNRESKLVKSVGRKGSGRGEFEYPRGLTVAGEQVLVCDQYNHRVQVFNTELEYVNHFGELGSRNGQFLYVEDIAADEHGNLYVSDRNNCRVQVFTSRGEFVHSIGKKGEGLGEFENPRGVCVDDQFVYVVDYENGQVSVFRKDGQFVYSFGKVRSPYGIAIDSNGFVYVCSDGSNKILIF